MTSRSDEAVPGIVAVTQVDRDAAAELCAQCLIYSTTPADIQDGKADEHHFVQAFARHRIEAADHIERLTSALEHLVRSVDDLIAESEGVYGLHLNGDPAPWDSLTEGGRFEAWLIELERARSALSLIRGRDNG